MKFTSILLYCCSVLCLTLSVECYGGYEPLRDFLRAHEKIKKGSMTLNTVDEENVIISSDEYSPVYVGNQYCLKEADKIVSLPGQPQVSFDQYSGYITVDPDAGRALFYYFTESEDPSNKPLVLWLNGGPACSSFGAGAMTELGPFRVNPDGETLWYNDYAWNKEANVIFLESPAGVGFSYSNRTSDYTTGDRKTALDSYTFLVNWFERFPEYKNRDFYIAGESYAGHYVPQLASLILHHNKNTNQTTVINLKGIDIGNALIDNEDGFRGGFDYYWTHALISDEIYQGIIDNCYSTSATSQQTNCQEFIYEFYNMTRDIWRYNIYAPLCTSTPSNSPSISGFDPCTDNYTSAYLNTPQVQEALHANITRELPGPWQVCNHSISKNWQDWPSTVLPTIMELMASGIRVWIYSGDTDGAVPVTATRYSFVKLNAPVKTPWYPWYTQGEVGGYAVEYENITFVTVRGSGHFVPSYQPQRALTLFSSFLAGKLPPRKKDD